MNNGKVAAYFILLIFTVAVSTIVFTPYVESVTAFKRIDAGKQMRSDPTSQGYTTWSSNLYFTGFSKAATGDILDFSSVKLGSTGYVMPRLGFCTDNVGVNMTVTSITQQYMMYTTTGAGTQRIWCPDRGEPYDITGESGSTWDAVNQVVNISTGGASTVTVTWYGTGSGNMYEGVRLIMVLLPFLLLCSVIGALKVPDHRVFFIQLAAISGVIIFIANLLAGLGL
jgi:hypothetical protein